MPPCFFVFLSWNVRRNMCRKWIIDYQNWMVRTWYEWTVIYWKIKLILNIKQRKHISSMPVSKALTSPICSWNYIYDQWIKEWCCVQRFVLYTAEECFVPKELEYYFFDHVMSCQKKRGHAFAWLISKRCYYLILCPLVFRNMFLRLSIVLIILIITFTGKRSIHQLTLYKKFWKFLYLYCLSL